MKKLISVVLCLALVFPAVILTIPASAATSSNSAAGYNQSYPLESADDFSWDNASVYFLLTDRFQNGNTSNDHSYGRTLDSNGQPISGWNTSPGTFHGGDFAGITQKINEGYFDKLGTNAIWISAPYEQIHGYVTPGGDNDFAHYSYHGYYVLDYTEPDLNFGTKQEFQTMVDTAHSHGIRVIMDVVMNHAGYNTLLDMKTYNFGTIKDSAGADSYIHRITNVNGLHDTVDYESSASDWGRWWGADWVRSGLPGYNQGGGDMESCLAGLPDFKTEQTTSVSIPPILQTKWQKEGTYNQKVSKYGSSDTVRNYISKWLAEWVETYGVDGFRCDTAKHVDLASWKTLKTTCSQALKNWRAKNSTKPGADWKDDFWMTGEHWGHGLGRDAYYSEGGFDSMINFAFSGRGVPDVSSIDKTYQNYASTINNDKGFNALTYISSHDSNLARNDLMYQGSAFQLMPGAIQIYYGDETNRPFVSGLNFDGDGGSGHSLRSDMNWNSADSAILAHWQKVGSFRAKHVAIGAGDHQQITAYNSATGYTFARSYDNGEMSDGIIAVIGAPKNTTIAVDVSSMWGNGVTLTNYYDGTTAVVRDGKAEFNSGAAGTILIEGPQSSIHLSVKGAYSFYDSETVTVSLRGADYAMASIAGGPSFRVTDGQTFTIGEGIEVGTVFEVTLSADNAEDHLEKTFKFKKKDPDAVTTLYFDDSVVNWGNVYAYIYDESGTNVLSNEKWPGKPMEFNSSLGLYTLDVEDELVNGQVIFNGGQGSPNRYPQGEGAKGLDINETSMILIGGNTWEVYDHQKPASQIPVDPSTMTTVYFDNTSSNFATPYIYYWPKGGSGDKAWPGVAMKKYKDNVYKASFAKANTMCIFSNQGGSKTGDLDIPGTDYIYNGTQWSVYADAEVITPIETPTDPADPQTPTEPSVPANTYLYGDANLDGKVNINDVTVIQMHLARITYLSELGIFLANVIDSNTLTIQDANAIQCYLARLYSHSALTGKYYNPSTPTQPTDPTEPSTPTNPTEPSTPTNPTEPSTPTEPAQPEKQYIYFKNTGNWSPVKAYFWSDSNEHIMDWPGIEMTNVTDDIFSVEIPEGATWVIFTQGSWQNQTANLKLEGADKLYNGSSWVGMYDT